MSRPTRTLLASALAVALLCQAQPSHAESCIPGFDYAIFTKNKIANQGNAGTDSWDSSQGTYAQTATCADGDIATNSSDGGAINNQGASSVICGDAWIGPGGNPGNGITGNGVITGSRGALPTTLSTPSVTIPALPAASPSNISTRNANTTLAPNHKYGSVSCKNGSLTLEAGAYVVTSLTLTSNCELRVASGPIEFYFTKGLYMQGGAVANDTGVPGNLVFYGGPSATDVQLQGGAKAYFAVYAPAASCQVQGNADIWGAVVCDTAEIQGNAHIHYDRALGSLDGGGFACSSTEISRSSPVVATIGSQDAVVQGTFESAAGTATSISSTGDVAGFTFPFLLGHMRARTTASITTTASTFADGTVLFDVGGTGKIPAANNAGCTSYTGACRHLFTITSAPAGDEATQRNPTMVSWDDGHASQIGALIAPTTTVPGIGASHWQTIVRKILAAPLGGVDRSTVAVIPASGYAGVSSRPTMVYFGAADGMLHAACGSTGGTTPSATTVCPALGTELWAFAPRVQLPLMRSNAARVDGSPHVLDVLGNFGAGSRSWRTVLLFQTGYQGTSTAATYALDITDPANPSVLWEHTARATPGDFELGTGMTIATGQVVIGAAPRTLAFVETNNGGTAGAGVVLTAIDVVTGETVWQFTHAYPSPPRGNAADLPLPTGVPGGAAAVDLQGRGFVTDVVFGDLYGNLWRLDAATGASQTGGVPLFQFTGNRHPIGVPPAIYLSGGHHYAVFASGGYVDPVATSWSATTQYVIGVRLDAAATPVDETTSPCSNCDLSIRTTLTNEKGFAQAVVVGSELFLTTDTSDVNGSTYGTGTNTGRSRTIDLGNEVVGAAVTIAAGAGTLGHHGTTLYTSSAQTQQQLAFGAATTDGLAAEIKRQTSYLRRLWLRIE
ncbi:MAG: hypothetical protein H6708_34530 [Kofleriaceae bacterium]|nr:hypothetical protein [Myxococcales bacterium]MCB9565531.1 hypothetical protein [Kofleriaceae bacterium]